MSIPTCKKVKRIGEILYKKRQVTKEELAKAVKIASNKGRLTGEILVELGFATEDQVTSALAEQAGVEYIDNIETAVKLPTTEMSKVISPRTIRKSKVIPIE